MAFGNEIKQSNITENWLFDFANDNSGYLRFALSDVTDSGNFYRGVILNTPSIRESIDLAQSTSKSSNISVTIPDFDYQGSPVSKELFGGSNNYMNHTVSVYSIVGAGSKQQIGSFRLTDISSDGNKITLSLTSYRPWDFLSFPNTKSTSNINIPIVYGDYTAHTEDTFQTGKKLFPIQKSKASDDTLYFITPKNYTSGASPHFYDRNNDIFIIMGDDAVATATFDGTDASPVNIELIKGTFLIRPSTVADTTEFTSTAQGIDGNLLTFSIASVDAEISGTGVDTDRKVFVVNMPRVQGVLREFKLHVNGQVNVTAASGTSNQIALGESTFSDASAIISRTTTGTTSTSGSSITTGYSEFDLTSGYQDLSDSSENTTSAINSTDVFVPVSDESPFNREDIIKIDDEFMRVIVAYPGANLLAVQRGYLSTKASHSSGATIYDVGNNAFKLPSELQLQGTAIVTGISAASCTGTVKIYDLFLQIKVGNDYIREPQSSEQEANDVEYVYLGADGLTHGVTDTAYNGNAITEIHEAHLDLLNRIAGLDPTDLDDDIDGWTALNASKDWRIRYWKHEETELKKALEQLQYEGGFIFRYKADGSPQYIHIGDSVTVSETLTKSDISKVSIKPSSFSELLTKMNISYRKHPAKNEYETRVASSNTTSITKWNIESKENIKEVKLDAYVGVTASEDDIPTSPSSNPNDDFYSYYDNIFGDLKMIVSCTIVNPKYYNLDVGSIIDFSDMYPETPYGYNSASWANIKFMITDIHRKAGELKITAREIA